MIARHSIQEQVRRAQVQVQHPVRDRTGWRLRVENVRSKLPADSEEDVAPTASRVNAAHIVIRETTQKIHTTGATSTSVA